MKLLLSALLAIAAIGGIDATDKCEVEPLVIFKDRVGHNSYDGITYSSALEGWTKLMIDPDSTPLHDGQIEYIRSDKDGEIQYVEEGKYIFLRVGAVSVWAFGGEEITVDEDDYSARDHLNLLDHVLQKPVVNLELAASVMGGVEIPFYNKRKVNAKSMAVIFTDAKTISFSLIHLAQLIFFGAEFDNSRSHGFFFLLPNDLEPGLYTIESDRELGNFLLPFSTGFEVSGESIFNICVGNHESCKDDRVLRRQTKERELFYETDGGVACFREG
eukprot:CAMPEP_0185723672 /NCGR_PEP_ID=MMETSP1171-20130828/428_1 /TAXON_ID=374046 /ORGANISM="Helicotheca tamensis, Strain CCMP826" /LENGTH=272 /DNA_ID=CAMNT_0028391411 /DNA_START=85 /DNA_END=904 /DNA_ORIENTATION=+